MNNLVLYPFLLTIFAGFSTLIGMFLIFFQFKNKNLVISLSMFFAGFVMLFVSIITLVPESMELLMMKYHFHFSVLLFFTFLVLGIVVSSVIDKFMDDKKVIDHKLYKVGIISMLAVILHNIPEGIATFMAGSTNPTLGLHLALAIGLHNIPEGIAISVPIFYATKSKKKAFFFTFLSALSEPFGALLAFLFLRHVITDVGMGFLLAFTCGIMIHIALYELFPTAYKYYNKKDD